MIVLCPKSLASLFSTGGDSSWLEKEFMKRMFSKCIPRAVVPNEVWEAFRFRIINSSPNKQNAEQMIAFFRSMITPEFEKLDENYQEIEPAKDYTNAELIEKTKDLVKRKYAEIEIFITSEPELYQDAPEIVNITILSVESYYTYHFVNVHKRHWVEEFLGEIERNKWE